MIKLDFSKPFPYENGKSLENADSIGKLISRILLSSTEERDVNSIIKFYEWGKILNNKGIIHVDTVDYEILRKKIIAPITMQGRVVGGFNNYQKGYILEIMDKSKEKAKK